MNEVTYGFVDENDILFATAVFVDEDTETIERVKNEYSASACYKMNLEKELALFGVAYWNGTRFLMPSPYQSWIFNEELNGWEAPVPYPIIEEGSNEIYTWDENTTSWLLLPPSN